MSYGYTTDVLIEEEMLLDDDMHFQIEAPTFRANLQWDEDYGWDVLSIETEDGAPITDKWGKIHDLLTDVAVRYVRDMDPPDFDDIDADYAYEDYMEERYLR